MKFTFEKDSWQADVSEFISDSIGVTVVTAWVVFVGAWTLNIMGVIVW
jgi:hypothetical protein